MISNVIGSPEMRIEIGPAIEMAARDTLVLASDGLLDNLLPTEIVELVRTGPLDKAVDQLVAVATERMNAPKRARPVEAGRSDGDCVPASLILPVALPVAFFDRIYRIGLEQGDALLLSHYVELHSDRRAGRAAGRLSIHAVAFAGARRRLLR